MKKMHLVSVLALSSIISAPAFAANGLEVKAGIGSVKDAGDRIGFDAALGYAIGFERFFQIVPELGFNWIKYDRSLGQTVTIGATTSTLTETRNHFTLPLTANLRFLIPMGAEESAIKPFVSVGAGYAWSFYKQETPAYSVGATNFAASSTNTDAGGLAWQALAGAQINLGMLADGSSSSTNIHFEVGYRGIEVERSGFKTNLSGWLFRAGAAFSF